MKLVVVGKRVGKCFRRPLCLFVFTALAWLCSALITSIALGEDSKTISQVLNSGEYLGGDPSVRGSPFVNARRITIEKDGLAYLNVKLFHESKPFTGQTFTDGDNWRATLTYKNGILDGPVLVIVNNKILSQFRYDKGKKVVE